MRINQPHFTALLFSLLFVCFYNLTTPNVIQAQFIEQQLMTEGYDALAKAAKQSGDAKRGAVVFYQPYMACTKCHLDSKETARLGPDLAKIDKKTTDQELIQSVLDPSKVIKKEYQAISVLLDDGSQIIGLLHSETKKHLILRSPDNGKLLKIAKDEIDEKKISANSIMPKGQVNSLTSRQQFLDLVRYLIEIRDGGQQRAQDLEPAAALYAKRPLPDYEKRIDHAGIISSFDQKAFQRGRAIYNRLCINCHGTHNKPGSLPTSLKFSSGKFKNGNDPYTMYQTLTRGFGMMAQQSWMVPQQKYDVIHYIREDYLKKHNPSQYFQIKKEYVVQLPKGDTRGPKPSNVQPWQRMDYGPNLIATYEIGKDGTNFAYKANAIRLDQGAGGVTRGRHWMIYDYDTMRVAAAWSGKGFIDYNCIHFNGRHNAHPRIVGNLTFENKTAPGWANPETGKFEETRLIGRDGRRYGPLPAAWAKYRGMYYHGQKNIISYTVGKTNILEMPTVQAVTNEQLVSLKKTSAVKKQVKKQNNKPSLTPIPIFQRTFNIGPRDSEMILQVASCNKDNQGLNLVEAADSDNAYLTVSANKNILTAGTIGNLVGEKWTLSKDNNLRLHIPKGKQPLKFTLWMTNTTSASQIKQLASVVEVETPDHDLSRFTKGGVKRWSEELKADVIYGDDKQAFAVDVFLLPVNNPWFCRMRLTGLDFYNDGDRMAVCDWEGNIWLVSGLKKLASKNSDVKSTLSWRRIASGLFQPLGIKLVEGKIYVTCRDQLCILHDLNNDGEIDFYENFNNDHQVTEHFHEFAMGLQVDKQGNFYYAKSARHALKALVPHHGTLLKVTRDGSKTEIIANGFRAANGVCINPDGSFIVTDQEGHWNPKNRINYVTKGGFYGNMFGYHNVTDSSDSAMQQPLCWITNSFDRSPAELMWVDSKTWGPLHKTLINFSYGYGQIYVVPHEKIKGQVQGGMCALPLPRFPTGLIRGRFHPIDGQLYACGMFAWAGSQTKPGGLYRIRYTNQAANLPLGLKAKKEGMEIRFSEKLDAKEAINPKNYQVKVWSLKRTKNYGSKHYDEHPLEIKSVKLAKDGKTVLLKMPKIGPTWCMEIRCRLKTPDGKSFQRIIHNTIHHLGE